MFGSIKRSVIDRHIRYFLLSRIINNDEDELLPEELEAEEAQAKGERFYSFEEVTGKTVDDILSEEDIADIIQARAEFARGEFVRHEDIDWS